MRGKRGARNKGSLGRQDSSSVKAANTPKLALQTNTQSTSEISNNKSNSQQTPALGSGRKRLLDESAVLSPDPSMNGFSPINSSDSNLANGHHDPDSTRPVKRTKRGSSTVESSYSLRRRPSRASAAGDEDHLADVGSSTALPTSLPGIEVEPPLDSRPSPVSDEATELVRPKLREQRLTISFNSKGKGKLQISNTGTPAESMKGSAKGSVKGSAKPSPTPGTGTPLNGMNSKEDARPGRRPPGRRRAPNADIKIEAALRRQLTLKTSFRSVAKSLKPILAELASRSLDQLEETETAYEELPEYQEIMAVLDNRLKKRLDTVDSKLEEELALLERQQEYEKVYIEAAYQSRVNTERETRVAQLLKTYTGGWQGGPRATNSTKDSQAGSEIKSSSSGLQEAPDPYVTNAHPLGLSRSVDQIETEKYLKTNIAQHRVHSLLQQWAEKSGNSTEGIEPIEPKEVSTTTDQLPSVNEQHEIDDNIGLILSAAQATENQNMPTEVEATASTLSIPTTVDSAIPQHNTLGFDLLMQASKMKAASTENVSEPALVQSVEQPNIELPMPPVLSPAAFDENSVNGSRNMSPSNFSTGAARSTKASSRHSSVGVKQLPDVEPRKSSRLSAIPNSPTPSLAGSEKSRVRKRRQESELASSPDPEAILRSRKKRKVSSGSVGSVVSRKSSNKTPIPSPLQTNVPVKSPQSDTRSLPGDTLKDLDSKPILRLDSEGPATSNTEDVMMGGQSHSQEAIPTPELDAATNVTTPIPELVYPPPKSPVWSPDDELERPPSPFVSFSAINKSKDSIERILARSASPFRQVGDYPVHNP
ncbi:hypothetical protein BT63DRAFT_195985 [Microthyrium microscopicum]|uniref:Uncharacterized protein n=1 Tax=Microthyrium microscopicum TaxID=703497 RepID=A0A6A6ULV6_9PEZI|nr:hypothetical protein BT63DRAFT_195985 [Microthyrium microscopicum]